MLITIKCFHKDENLIDAGHTRIGYCIGRSNSINSQRRKQAYADSLQQIAEKPIGTWKFEGCFTVEDGRNVIRSGPLCQ